MQTLLNAENSSKKNFKSINDIAYVSIKFTLTRRLKVSNFTENKLFI